MGRRTFCLAVSLALTAFAQLNPTAYGKWESLGQATLSPDGKWLAHEIGRTRKTAALAFWSAAAFSTASRWLACETTISESDPDKLKRAKKTLQNNLTVLALAAGKSTVIGSVQGQRPRSQARTQEGRQGEARGQGPRPGQLSA